MLLSVLVPKRVLRSMWRLDNDPNIRFLILGKIKPAIFFSNKVELPMVVYHAYFWAIWTAAKHDSMPGVLEAFS